jgi:hypothetical protein
LDVIGDAQLAVRAFLDGEVEPSSEGASYLLAYGTLQALYIQQDAVRTIAGALAIPWKRPAVQTRIRYLRNAAIGHPTDLENGSKSTRIARYTLSGDGFLLSITGAESDHEEYVSLPNVCREHTQSVAEQLLAFLGHLRREEQLHREKFRHEKLCDAFPTTLGYSFEKLSAGFHKDSADPMAGWGLASIAQALRAFRDRLDARGLLGAYSMSIDPQLEEIDFVIGRLEQLLGGQYPSLTHRDGPVYVHFLRSRVSELMAVAAEIDLEYAHDIV